MREQQRGEKKCGFPRQTIFRITFAIFDPFTLLPLV